MFGPPLVHYNSGHTSSDYDGVQRSWAVRGHPRWGIYIGALLGSRWEVNLSRRGGKLCSGNLGGGRGPEWGAEGSTTYVVSVAFAATTRGIQGANAQGPPFVTTHADPPSH